MKRLRIIVLALIVLAMLSSVLWLPRKAAKEEIVRNEQPVHPVRSGVIGSRQTFNGALLATGVSSGDAYDLLQELGRYFDLRKCQPADSFLVERDTTDTIIRFTYMPQKDIKTFNVRRASDGRLFTEVEAPQLSVHLAAVSGKIGSSLYESMSKLGLKPKVIMDYAAIFQWDVDFLTEPQKGDDFSLVFEEIRAGGRFVQYGDILVARYHSRTYDKTAYRFAASDGEVHYYDGNGESFQKAFLKSPLNYTRISSTFGPRLHPITRKVRMHNGVDFAAPKGTPVEASADGIISHRNWLGGHPGGGGYGNTVKIRHASGYETLYGHLSGFAPGLKVGDHVSQHTVIGYVGSTGMSTGNHLHYTIYHEKAAVDPLKMQNLAGPPISSEDRQRFSWTKSREQMLLDLFAVKGLNPEIKLVY
jgi:murein DD-endopeptidase MepM/ murein hydrolase activator NlpD